MDYWGPLWKMRVCINGKTTFFRLFSSLSCALWPIILLRSVLFHYPWAWTAGSLCFASDWRTPVPRPNIVSSDKRYPDHFAIALLLPVSVVSLREILLWSCCFSIYDIHPAADNLRSHVPDTLRWYVCNLPLSAVPPPISCPSLVPSCRCSGPALHYSNYRKKKSFHFMNLDEYPVMNIRYQDIKNGV